MLFRSVLGAGRLLGPLPSLEEIRQFTAASLAHLPERYRRLDNPATYVVRRTAALEQLLEEVRERCTTPSSSM